MAKNPGDCRSLGIVGIAEVTMWQLPVPAQRPGRFWLPHPRSTESWLALWECEGAADRDSTPCSLFSRVCGGVRVCAHGCTCVHWRRAWDTGPEKKSILLMEYTEAGMKDSNKSLASSSGPSCTRDLRPKQNSIWEELG